MYKFKCQIPNPNQQPFWNSPPTLHVEVEANSALHCKTKLKEQYGALINAIIIKPKGVMC